MDAIDVESIGEEVPLLEGIRTTRSIRRLRPAPVPPELIRKVCEAGTFAPSGGNRQPWSFIAVTDPERREFVAGRYRAAFLEYIRPAHEAAKDPSFPEARRRTMRSAEHLALHLSHGRLLVPRQEPRRAPDRDQTLLGRDLPQGQYQGLPHP